MHEEFLFDGFCPESLLKGKQVEMYLNRDDFLESKETGLQITVFPPYATILKWRGNGNFRVDSLKASDILSGLILTEPHWQEEKEIFPDERKIIDNSFDLEWYLAVVYENIEQYDKDKFREDDPAIKEQKDLLKRKRPGEWDELFTLIEQLKTNNYNTETGRQLLSDLHEKLYSMNIVFPFNWKHWYRGAEMINDLHFDYSKCTACELSMLITTIYRNDRFCDGFIEANFENGVLPKIFETLKDRVRLTSGISDVV